MTRVMAISRGPDPIEINNCEMRSCLGVLSTAQLSVGSSGSDQK